MRKRWRSAGIMHVRSARTPDFSRENKRLTVKEKFVSQAEHFLQNMRPASSPNSDLIEVFFQDAKSIRIPGGNSIDTTYSSFDGKGVPRSKGKNARPGPTSGTAIPGEKRLEEPVYRPPTPLRNLLRTRTFSDDLLPVVVGPFNRGPRCGLADLAPTLSSDILRISLW